MINYKSVSIHKWRAYWQYFYNILKQCFNWPEDNSDLSRLGQEEKGNNHNHFSETTDILPLQPYSTTNDHIQIKI